MSDREMQPRLVWSDEPERVLVGSLDWYAIDRILAVPHRDDDQPCACDECMSYGAEEAGADWYRLSPVRRIALRALDSADDRLAPLRDVIHENVNEWPSSHEPTKNPLTARIDCTCGYQAYDPPRHSWLDHIRANPDTTGAREP